MRIIAKTEKETLAFAKKFGKNLKGGEIIGLVGDLGAGKTTFTKGLAAGLGVKRTITSPTFVLMRVYKIKDIKIKNFIHIDAYRLKNARDLSAIGAEEYFTRPGTVVAIEWADRIKKILPRETIFIEIKNKKENERIINI